MGKAAITLSTLALVLLGAVVLSNWQIHRDLGAVPEKVFLAVQGASDQHGDNMRESLNAKVPENEDCDGVRESLDLIGTRVDEQTAIINRALGTIIPHKLPDDVNIRIASIQEKINSAIKTPANAASIERIRSELAGIVDALPPWAQEEILPTLVPLRWNLEALWALANAGGVRDEDLEGFIESLTILLENRPIGSPESLSSKLEDQSRTLNLQIVAVDKATAITNAAALAPARPDEDLRDAGALTEAIQGLAPYLDDARARELSAKLTQQFAHRMVVQATNDLSQTIDQYRRLPSADLRQHAFARASQTAADLLLQLISAGVSDAQLTKRLQSLHSSTRELEQNEIAAARKSASLREAAQRKQYQEWALNQMAKVRTLKALEETGLTEPKALLQLRRDMTKYLAPIDEGLLDVAVGQWFRKVYANRFEELADEGKPKLIGSFASTPKMTLEALP